MDGGLGVKTSLAKAEVEVEIGNKILFTSIKKTSIRFSPRMKAKLNKKALAKLTSSQPKLEERVFLIN